MASVQIERRPVLFRGCLTQTQFIACRAGRRRQPALQELERASAARTYTPLLIAFTGDQPAGVIPAESRLASALVARVTLEEYALRRGAN